MTLTSSENYVVVNRPHGSCWLHNTKPVWIVFYDAVPCVRMASYTVYKSVERVPHGRNHWTVDNRNIADHVQTLEEAMDIGDEVVA